MFRSFCIAVPFLALFAVSPAGAKDHLDANGNSNSGLDTLIAKHAAANNVPEELVRRVIKRESRGNARAVSKGNFGLMQIRLATARGLGYRGSAEGLLDADTNMTYAVKYLAGAYRVAGGNQNRAVQYYAAGYYYAAKRNGTSVQQAAASPMAGFKIALDGNGSPTSAMSSAAANSMASESNGAGARVSDAYMNRPDYQ